MNILEYEFMRRALIIGVCISVITPLMGQSIVLKGLSNIGEALSHTALSGIALGLLIGIDPLIGAICMSLLGALSIEVISKWFSGYEEIATTIILSLGIGLASIFSGYIDNSALLNGYMFGSLVAVSDLEIYLTLALSVVVVVVYILNYNNLFNIAFDTDIARLRGVKVKRVNFLFTVCCAITVSVASRTVGALIVSSLLVIPVACAFKVSKSYFSSIFISIGFALFFTLSGLLLSFYFDVKTGGAIVLIGIFTLVVLLLIKKR